MRPAAAGAACGRTKSRLASQEAGEARRESQGPISAQDADAEPDRAEGIFHLAPGDQPLAVNLSIPAEQLADPSERRDASRQDVVVGILLALDEHGPVAPSMKRGRDRPRALVPARRRRGAGFLPARAPRECGGRAHQWPAWSACRRRGSSGIPRPRRRRRTRTMRPTGSTRPRTGRRVLGSWRWRPWPARCRCPGLCSPHRRGPARGCRCRTPGQRRARAHARNGQGLDQDGPGGPGQMAEARVVDIGQVFPVVIAHRWGTQRQPDVPFCTSLLSARSTSSASRSIPAAPTEHIGRGDGPSRPGAGRTRSRGHYSKQRSSRCDRSPVPWRSGRFRHQGRTDAAIPVSLPDVEVVEPDPRPGLPGGERRVVARKTDRLSVNHGEENCALGVEEKNAWWSWSSVATKESRLPSNSARRMSNSMIAGKSASEAWRMIASMILMSLCCPTGYRPTVRWPTRTRSMYETLGP